MATRSGVHRHERLWKAHSVRRSRLLRHQIRSAKLRDVDGSFTKEFESLGFHPARPYVKQAGLVELFGVLHADQRNRDSLALDAMEPVRGNMDTLLLDLLEDRVFTREISANFQTESAGLQRH
jgi:hypothetical protein